MIDPFGDLNRMAAEPPAHTWKAFIGMEQFVPLVIGRRSRRRHLAQPNGQMESSTATSVTWLRERASLGCTVLVVFRFRVVGVGTCTPTSVPRKISESQTASSTRQQHGGFPSEQCPANNRPPAPDLGIHSARCRVPRRNPADPTAHGPGR